MGSEVSTWPGCMFLSVPLLSVLGELRDAPPRHLRFKICREMVTSAQRSGTLSFASVASVPFGSSVRLCPVFWYSGHYATWFFPRICSQWRIAKLCQAGRGACSIAFAATSFMEFCCLTFGHHLDTCWVPTDLDEDVNQEADHITWLMPQRCNLHQVVCVGPVASE